ncbi:hypothetical protein CG007_00060 [Mesoplasma entomophilum]|nr:hypothetical protein CG007_00060 [Mesoplasma entomophilum]
MEVFMKITFQNLIEMSEDSNDTTNKIISKTILENLMKGKFLSQNEISKICFVSASTVTKFSQTIGFSGYREMMFHFKNEFLTFSQNKQSFRETNSFKNLEEWIFRNRLFIDTFVEEVSKTEKINIFYSWELANSAQVLYEILLEKNKKAFIINHNQVNISFLDNSINVFLISGKDNRTLKKIHSEAKKQVNSKIFTVASKLSGLVEISDSQNIMYDMKDDFSNGLHRNVASQLLMLEIYKKL